MDILCKFCKPAMPPGREYGYATVGGRYHHPGQCREVETPWITIDYDGTDDHVDLTRDFNPYELAGLAMRDEVYEPEGHPFPEGTPGYKRLDDGLVEAIVVIVRGETPEDITPQYTDDEDAGTSWEIHYRVRPATPEEAAGVLIDEREGAFDGRVS